MIGKGTRTGISGRPLIASALLAIAVAGPVEAETLRVRSGEHDGFSRIVLDGAADLGWTLGRIAEGYGLRLEQDSVTYDTGGVFRAIPRDRIAELDTAEDGALRLRLGCECHAKAFVTGSGALVIDIADGAAPPGSPYETRLRPATPPAQAPETPAPHPDTVDTPTHADWRPPKTDFRRQDTADPKLAFFWRGVVPDAAAPGTTTGATRVAATDNDDEGPPADNSPTAPVEPRTEPPAHALPAASLPTIPDPRVTAAQADLLHQFGRAAAQGLLEVDTARVNLPSHNAPAQAPARPDSAPEPDGWAAEDASAPRLHAETSIDRDSVLVSTKQPVTADGGTCIGPEELDIADWGDDRPIPAQIAERRQPLVGEFDRSSEDAVLALARLYIHLGFGAEARTVLHAFGTGAEAAGPLADLGMIVDGQRPGAASGLARMTGCDTPAALWAILAWPELPPDADVDQGAVLRAFSALPPHLRRSLGPDLSERLLSVRAEFAARSIRDAIARSPAEATPALSLIDARLDIARGDGAAAEMQVDALARSNDPLSADALVLTIRSKLDRGEAIDRDLTESIAALAYERQDGPTGPVLSQLHILSLGSAGDLAEAFQALHRWPGAPAPDVQDATALSLFSMLAGQQDDATFLRGFFDQRTLLDSLDPDVGLRLALAERLMASGFTAEVRALVSGRAGRSENGRRLLAEAALAKFEPELALTELAGLTGATIDNLRAQALTMAGDHRGAAAAFAAAEELTSAGHAAWRSGDWVGVAEHGSDPMRQAVEDFGLIRQDMTPTAELDPEGELARGRALLRDSQSIRATLDDLLAATNGDG